MTYRRWKVKSIYKQKFSAVRTLHFALLALVFCAAMPSAWARQHKPDPSQAVLVVAHVPFNGKSLTDMSIQTQANGNRYLYIEHAPEQGVSVLDIAKPAEPRLVSFIRWRNTKITHIKGVMAEAVLTQADANSAASQSETQPTSDPLVVWDTSEPSSPRLVQRFANVRRVLSDDRGYVYILNTEGLWVISTPAAYQQDQPERFQNIWDWLASFGG